MAKKRNNIINDFLVKYGSPEEEKYVDQNLNITQQIYALLDEKGWTQKELAKALGKTAAEVSKWLSGTHNFTLRSITKLEIALGADIILTPQKAEQRYKKIKYVKVKVHALPNKMMETKIYKPEKKNLNAPARVKVLQKICVA